MSSRRGFLKAIAAVPAALALVDLRKVVPSAPANAKAFGVAADGSRRYVYVRAGEALHVGDVVKWADDGQTVVRGDHSSDLLAGVAMGSLTDGNYGWVMVNGPYEFKVRR